MSAQAPESFVSRGFFNAFFETKEYAEPYIMEPFAQKMLAENPALRAEFEAKLAPDEEFRKDADLRLDFFHERSPYFKKAERAYPIMHLPHND